MIERIIQADSLDALARQVNIFIDRKLNQGFRLLSIKSIDAGSTCVTMKEA